MKKLLIGVTGSVAAIKLPVLIERFSKFDAQIIVVCTESSRHFFDVHQTNVKIYQDADEWSSWTKRGDPVLHIDLTKWADIFLIAPLDANTMAKMANGICDNLLTCIIRAWNPSKPLVFCPAMNTQMWNHPITNEHVNQLIKWGYKMIPCVEKTLMCGDTGLGAMAEVDTIVSSVSGMFL